MWADQVMPAYTTWANAFEEGWPSIVNGTRHVVAAFVSLGYGLQMSFDMIYDTVEEIVRSIGGGFGAIGAAISLALEGEFTAAKTALISGWEDSIAQLKGIGARIVGDAQS